MRDPSRINEFCDILKFVWETKYPDLRFGQLIDNVCLKNKIGSLFYIEDDQLLEHIKNY